MDSTEVTYAQRKRLAYIDFKLLFIGHISRSEIVTAFEQGLSAASRDLSLYKSLCPNNLAYDASDKRYYKTDDFTPLYPPDPVKTLSKLAHHISDGFDGISDSQFPIEAPSQLSIPDIYVLAALVRAITNRRAVKVIYTSLSSGSGARELVPHTIVDNGLRWHVRAFDRKSQCFRDFVLTRISRATVIAGDVEGYEEQQEDTQWIRVMPLKLTVHPHNIKFPTAIELDYGMSSGQLVVEVRAAMAGYLLRRWNVDCSEGASLRGPEYQLWLSNQHTLYGAENLAIAPGYDTEPAKEYTIRANQ